MKSKFLFSFVTCFMVMGMTTFAAEPTTETEDQTSQIVETVAPSSEDVIVIDITDEGLSVANEQAASNAGVVVANADNEVGIMPLSETRGYTCIHSANNTVGTFKISTNGGSSNSGYLQVAARSFSKNPLINIVLYRPNGTYAGEVYLYPSDQTKSIRFTNATSGTYTGSYSVEGNSGGEIDLWISW